MYASEMFAALFGITVRALSLPDDLIEEFVLAEDLIEHHFDVVARVPVAVVVEAAGLLEDASQLDAARAHVVDVGLRAGVAVLEGPPLPGLAPEDLVVAVAVEGRVDVDQVHAAVGQLAELVQAVAAVDATRIEQRLRAAAGPCGPVLRGSRSGRSAGRFLRHVLFITRAVCTVNAAASRVG